MHAALVYYTTSRLFGIGDKSSHLFCEQADVFAEQSVSTEDVAASYENELVRLRHKCCCEKVAFQHFFR
jgi:hypothetical protein